MIAVVMFALALRASPAVHVADLDRFRTRPVAALEVDDYVYGGYEGAFPSPPHADQNPRKAVVIVWKDFPYRFVFSHEASYCPWMELPSGAAASFQMWEGNDGWAELFNQEGRKERNSFIDIVEDGPDRVWVRWIYFGVNRETGAAAYRGVEDFWAFPNGLILRRQLYHTLMPGDHRGYAREPIELITLCPAGKRWFDVLARDPATAESRAFTGLNVFSPGRVDILWKRVSNPAEIRRIAEERKLKHTPNPLYFGTSCRTGIAWNDFDDARGVAMITPLADGSPFAIIGDSSGFPYDKTRLKDHSDRSTGGWGWGTESWDHWPIGWLNSQAHTIDENSLRTYPNHFAVFGLDLWQMRDEETENREFFSLLGVSGTDVEAVRRIGREWLTESPRDPRSVSRLRVRPNR